MDVNLVCVLAGRANEVIMEKKLKDNYILAKNQ